MFTALSFTAVAQAAHAGPVIGWIDAIRYQNGQYYIVGWACREGNRDPIYVFFYADRAPWDKPPGPTVTGGQANLDNELAVDRACHDANGGKHRFEIAVSNQLLRTFQNRKLYARGWVPAGDQDGPLAGAEKFVFPQPKWLPDPPTPDFFDGPQTAAFDTEKESCEQTDIPDAPARAFRDFRGRVHLIASVPVTRAGVGPTLETAKHNCQVVYKSHLDGNPADFDDQTWLGPFYNIDGKRIVALGHLEYHGWDHPGMCASKTDDVACWYNGETFNISEDGGYHFSSPPPPANYVLSVPYRYQVNQGPVGYTVNGNIVKVGEWYYGETHSWSWPQHCGDAKGQRSCLIRDGSCAIRTNNILDPTSWRGWDGKGFNVSFVNPYRGVVENPQSHVCTPVPYLDYSNGINYHPTSHLFIATLWNQGSASWGPEGVYFTTSSDFVHWSAPELAATLNQFYHREPEGDWSYGYFSLIDPKSEDSSYMTITDSPYLYYVRFDGGNPPYQRTLFRQKIRLGWLTKTKPRTAPTAGVNPKPTH